MNSLQGKKTMIEPLKLYILVRSDLSASQRTVQACHALANLMLRHNHDLKLRKWADQYRTLVILAVENLHHLNLWEEELRVRQIPCEHFAEPDLNSEKTALAVHPCADSKLFNGLRLL